MENIPSFIFDLLETKSFVQLSKAERNEVLQHIPADEYNALHQAAMLAKAFTKNSSTVADNPSQKELLLKRFSEKYQQRPPLTLILNKPVRLWKVAAMFLLLGGSGTLFLIHAKKNATEIKYITRLDTVYLENTQQAARIYDTVYLTEEVSPRERSVRSHSHHANNVYQSLPEELPSGYEDINRLSIREKDKPLNNKKGVNIKDDSLINTYGFVRL